jgi:hypothetical protein
MKLPSPLEGLRTIISRRHKLSFSIAPLSLAVISLTATTAGFLFKATSGTQCRPTTTREC